MSRAQIQTTARRRSATGYARGDETRLRIIQAAVELFGANGYERTSTRDIAARAGVNAPALQYYFEGKEGLYLACAEHMAERGWALLEPAITEVRKRLSGKIDRDGLIDCVCIILDRSADFIPMAAELETWARFVAWEDLDGDRAPSSACAVIDTRFKREVQGLFFELVGRIIGRPADDAETRIRVLTLGSQVSVFHKSRQKALQAIGWPEVDAEGLQMIKKIIRQQTKAILHAARPVKNSKTSSMA